MIEKNLQPSSQYVTSSNSSIRNFTRGGQITFHNLRMLFQINKAVGKLYLFALVALTFVMTYLIAPREIILAAYYWCYSQASSVLNLLGYTPHVFAIPYHGATYYETPESFLSQIRFIENAHSILYYFIGGFVIAFIMSMAIAAVFVKWLIIQGEKRTSNQFLRGSRLDTTGNVAKQIKKDKRASDIYISNLPLVAGSETQHILIHGTTGSGKTQLIAKLLDHLRRRGDKVFLYDKGGVYTPIYYRSGKDKILNPFDARCENWDLWHEALNATDFENMAESLIPMHGETDPFWVNAARTIFGSAAYTMQDDKDRSITKLLKLLLTSELKELEKYLIGTEAATLTSDKIEKTAISIRSIITTYLKSLRFLHDLDRENKSKFSIRSWIHDFINDPNKSDDGWLFISSNAAQHASLRPLLSMWFAMASITLLSLPENRDRRIWFICDELPSLHKLPQLPETIAEARKFGGCFVLGMQSYAQLEKVYGRNAGREIFDLLNTRFFFRSPSADLAKFVSQELGEQEIEDMRENYSYGANSIRDGISIGTQQMTKPIVFYPEIMELPDMKCYVRLPAEYPVTLLDLELEQRKKIEAAFIARDLAIDPEMEESIQQIERKALGKVKVRKIVHTESALNVEDVNVSNDNKDSNNSMSENKMKINRIENNIDEKIQI